MVLLFNVIKDIFEKEEDLVLEREVFINADKTMSILEEHHLPFPTIDKALVTRYFDYVDETHVEASNRRTIKKQDMSNSFELEPE